MQQSQNYVIHQNASSLCLRYGFEETLLPRNSHETMWPTKMPPIYHVDFTWSVTWVRIAI